MEKTNNDYLFYCFEWLRSGIVFQEIWVASKETAFSDMEFEEFKKTATNLMKNRGIKMLNKLCGN